MTLAMCGVTIVFVKPYWLLTYWWWLFRDNDDDEAIGSEGYWPDLTYSTNISIQPAAPTTFGIDQPWAVNGQWLMRGWPDWPVMTVSVAANGLTFTREYYWYYWMTLMMKADWWLTYDYCVVTYRTNLLFYWYSILIWRYYPPVTAEIHCDYSYCYLILFSILMTDRWRILVLTEGENWLCVLDVMTVLLVKVDWFWWWPFIIVMTAWFNSRLLGIQLNTTWYSDWYWWRD